MGVSYSSHVIYGVPETAELRFARTVRTNIWINQCSKHPSGKGHGKFCAECGEKLSKVSIQKTRKLSVTEAYAPDDRKDDEDWEMQEDCIVVQRDYMSGENVFFGISLGGMEPRFDSDPILLKQVSDIPVEKLNELKIFIENLGYSEYDLALYLVPGYS